MPARLRLVTNRRWMILGILGLVGSSPALLAAAPGGLVAWGTDSKLISLVPKEATNFVAVTSGMWHAAALDDQGRVAVWSISTLADLTLPEGLGRVQHLASGIHHSVALREDGRVVSWGAWSHVPEDLGPVVRVGAGQVFSLALKPDGRVVAWSGDPRTLRDLKVLQVPDSVTNVVAMDGGFLHALALRSDGTVVAWGDNDYGQINVPHDLTNVVAISAGTTHCAALRADGTVVGWGGGEDPYGMARTPPGLSNVVELVATSNNTVARTSDGQLVAWGENSSYFESAPIDPREIRQMAGRGYVLYAIVGKADPVSAPTPMQMNRSTGLFEQDIVLRNTGATLLPGMRVLISGLPEDVIVYNAGGTIDGLPFVEYRSPLAPDAVVTVRMEFHRSSRQAFDTPRYTASSLGAEGPARSGEPLEVGRRLQIAPGRVMIEFPAQPGARYVVEYTDNLGPWRQAVPTIIARATRVRWVDSGPPKTHSIPWGQVELTHALPNLTNAPAELSATNRFYRVLRLLE